LQLNGYSEQLVHVRCRWIVLFGQIDPSGSVWKFSHLVRSFSFPLTFLVPVVSYWFSFAGRSFGFTLYRFWCRSALVWTGLDWFSGYAICVSSRWNGTRSVVGPFSPVVRSEPLCVRPEQSSFVHSFTFGLMGSGEPDGSDLSVTFTKRFYVLGYVSRSVRFPTHVHHWFLVWSAFPGHGLVLRSTSLSFGLPVAYSLVSLLLCGTSAKRFVVPSYGTFVFRCSLGAWIRSFVLGWLILLCLVLHSGLL
jgi:hypothetical protein